MPRAPNVLNAILGICLGIPAVGCSSPESDVIASDADGAKGDGGLSTPRGRVSVVDGKLVTDIGTPLRGVLLAVDTGFTLDDFELLTSIAKTTGLNAVHVYLENASQETGVAQNQADALVSLTAQAGLYLVLGLGGGIDNGSFDIDKVRSFWTLYAQRYRNSPHVLFEVQNNPERLCDAPLAASTISMELEAYSLIRRLAPASHVVLYSLSATPTAPMLKDCIERVSDVDWSNASIAFHSEPECVPATGTVAALTPARDAKVALLVNQLSPEGWAEQVAAAEQGGVGWFQYHWLAQDRSVATFQTAIRDAGLSWCPDQGSFPEDASKCR